MSWGCDTALYRTVEAMRTELRCGRGWPTVIKRNRGNGGQGVWKVEALESPRNRPMNTRAGCHQRRMGGTVAGRVSRGLIIR
jgi:hypothetical protein